MTIEDLSPFALQRVTAYEGLAIDATTWTDAHAYHQTAQRLHTRALHGWGIVSGLRIEPVDPPDRGVILQPGVAVDHDGNVIRVPQPVRLALPQGASGTVCCVVRFTEAPVQSGNSTPISRVNEFFNLLATPPPVRPSDLEVARIEIANPTAPVRAAAVAWEPAAQEIDLRFRRELGLPSADTLRVGQLSLGDQQAAPLHRRGLYQMLRHLRAAAPFAVQFAGDLRADALVGSCDLLYLAGAGAVKIAPKEGAQLIAFLRAGGTLFAEPCAEREGQSQENGRFVATLSRLLADLKYEVAPLDGEHPVFSARHTFGVAPDGVGGHAPLVGAAHVILNPNDYGCCWQGGPPGKPQAREVIRAATEFAENLAWYAAGEGAAHARQNGAGKAPAR